MPSRIPISRVVAAGTIADISKMRDSKRGFYLQFVQSRDSHQFLIIFDPDPDSLKNGVPAFGIPVPAPLDEASR